MVVALVATAMYCLKVSPVILEDFRRVALKDLPMAPKDLKVQATLFKAMRRFPSAPIILIPEHLKVLATYKDHRAIRATRRIPAVILIELTLQATKVQVTIKGLKALLKDPTMDCQASRNCQTIRLVDRKHLLQCNLLTFLHKANKMA